MIGALSQSDILRIVLLISNGCVLSDSRLYHRKHRKPLEASGQEVNDDIDFIVSLLKKELDVFFNLNDTLLFKQIKFSKNL